MDTMIDYTVPGGRKLGSGKVREIFEAGPDHLLIVTTDRLSAFDVVLPDPIPYKGHVLNQISRFWFGKASGIIDNHVVTLDVNRYPAPFRGDLRLEGRSMLVKKARPLAVECIVRGYISGSGWKEYRSLGSISGIKLAPGLVESEKLPEPIFTPATKAEMGQHDENVSFEKAAEAVGLELAEKLRDISLELYKAGSAYAASRGVIIADTKFEFGLDENGRLMLIDEVLTPDSSRFWPADKYAAGRDQESFDKQFVRNYLDEIGFNRTPPGPVLPKEVVQATRAKYIEAYELLTGRPFQWA